MAGKELALIEDANTTEEEADNRAQVRVWLRLLACTSLIGAELRRQFREEFGELEVIPNLENPKGELQELLQASSTEAPQYQLESVTGPDHDRLFESAVYHQGAELGRGIGKSKKEAESRAALAALEDALAAAPLNVRAERLNVGGRKNAST